MCAGVSKSGWPAAKLTIGRPAAARALALLSTRSVADSAMFAMRGEIGWRVAARGTLPRVPSPRTKASPAARPSRRSAAVGPGGVRFASSGRRNDAERQPFREGGAVLLENKVIVVTGGNSGIGAAIVRAAAAEGAKVVIDYVAHEDATEKLVDEIKQAGSGDATGVEADISKPDDLHRMMQAAIDTYGRLDVLVNNAGIETRQSLLDSTEADYDKVMAVNMKSAFFASQAAAKQFIAQKTPGLILNISSVHEDWPMPGNIAYCVSKGGMRMLARTAGVELGQHGTRMVNVAPGARDTPINAQTTSNKELLGKLTDAIPLRRVAEPADIGDVVVFLASGKASYMTATTVVVDGGIMQGSVGL